MIKKNILNYISSKIPIPSLDIVIQLGNEFLVVRRKKNPAKNKYTFIGGVLHKKITIDTAIKKIIKREINIHLNRKAKLIDVKKFSFLKNFSGKNNDLEYFSAIFYTKISKKEYKNIKLDADHSDYKLMDKNKLLKNDKVLNQVKKVIKDNF